MADSERERADRKLEEALAATGARDPREFYRERLRELKTQNPAGYAEAVRHYEETLVPAVASGEADPLATWTDYGRLLAELAAPGRSFQVDATGRAAPFESPADPDRLVLHVPDARGARPLLVALPAELTPAQRATYDWLVGGRRALPGA